MGVFLVRPLGVGAVFVCCTVRSGARMRWPLVEAPYEFGSPTRVVVAPAGSVGRW